MRYLIPVVLATFCVARGVTLTSAIERSRAATGRTARASSTVHAAAGLVSELRFASAEHLTTRAVGMHQEWGRLLGVLELLSRDRVYGGEQFHEQVGRTSSLLDAARKAAGLPPARAQAAAEGIRLEASAAWAGWQLVETELTRRLMVDLSMPEDKAASIALLAALGCVSCALLLWQTWHAGQLRNDAALVESKVRESDARYRAMTETAREVLIQADPSGRILRSNHKLAVTEMTALFSQPHTWEKTIAGLERTVGGGPAPPVEAWIAGEGDGSPVEWRAFPVRDAAGRLVRVDSALLDVGTWYAARQAAQSRIAEHEQSLRKLQLQLRELLDQSFELAESRAALEQASQARIEALCNWGRRVSQPLEEAAALASRLRSNARPLHPNDTAALVQAVDSVAASLRALADFAGLERGALELAVLPFSPRSVVEESVESVAERAEVRHLELPCFVHQDVPAEVIADARRLRKVLGTCSSMLSSTPLAARSQCGSPYPAGPPRSPI